MCSPERRWWGTLVGALHGFLGQSKSKLTGDHYQAQNRTSSVWLLVVVLISGIVIDRVPARAQNGAGDKDLEFSIRKQGAIRSPRLAHEAYPFATFFDTGSPGAPASCGSAGCSAFAPIYSEKRCLPRGPQSHREILSLIIARR